MISDEDILKEWKSFLSGSAGKTVWRNQVLKNLVFDATEFSAQVAKLSEDLHAHTSKIGIDLYVDEDISNGDVVEDDITGFSGVVVATTEYLTGCIQYQVQPTELKEGKTVKAEWFDEQRLTHCAASKRGGPTPGEEMPTNTPSV